MKIIQTLSLKHRIFTPKTHKRAYEILRRISHAAPVVGAELGVYRGALSRILLKTNTHIHLYMVDSWEGDGASYRGESGNQKIEVNLSGMNECSNHAKARTIPMRAVRQIFETIFKK